MDFAMPPVTVIRDSAGQNCLRAADALKIAQALAADPALPFHFNHSCGFRAELMIGRLLTNGLSPEMVHRTFIEAVEEERGGESLHSSARKSPPSASFQRLVGGAPAAYPADVALEGTDVTIHFEDEDSILVQGRNKTQGRLAGWEHTAGKGFNFTADGEWSIYSNHVTVALPVRNERTGRAEIKVIDTYMTSPPRLLSFREWKAMQNCDSAVILDGPVGRLPDIIAEEGCLRPQDREKLTALILEEAPDLAPGHPGPMTEDETADALARLDRQTADRVTAAIMNIDPARNPNHAADPRYLCSTNYTHFPDFGNSVDYERKRLEDRQRADNTTSCDWDSLAEDDRRTLVRKWTNELAPLAAVDKRWREKFMSADAMPAPDGARTVSYNIS